MTSEQFTVPTSEIGEAKMHDLIKEFRARFHEAIGWDRAAEEFEQTIPKQYRITDMAMYFGVLYGLAIKIRPEVIVDIGAQHGISARAWLAATAPLEGKVHSIDVDPDCAKMQEELGPRWIFHQGRSQDIEPIPCDLLYVDGDHSYPAVCSDMARHGPLVRDGGLVVLDDVHRLWPGKLRWVQERWDEIDPIAIGPTVVIRVTPYKRRLFSKVFLP